MDCFAAAQHGDHPGYLVRSLCRRCRLLDAEQDREPVGSIQTAVAEQIAGTFVTLSGRLHDPTSSCPSALHADLHVAFSMPGEKL
jgi:hypothetical protein